MAIPSQTDMFGVVLEAMQDGEARGRKATFELVAIRLGLSPEECAEMTRSGTPVYESRVSWGISYLHRANLLDKVSRGVYRINDAGVSLNATGLRGKELLREIEAIIAEVNPWNVNSDGKQEAGLIEDSSQDKSPEEQIADLVSDVNDALRSELLDLVLEVSPKEFEKLVVKLIERMGYGRGKVTQYSHDGGIDGIVATDSLGFWPILVQAKRLAPGTPVGQPTLQEFAGALNGMRDGVFVTTSHFTKGAEEFASRYPHATIALIDGAKLTELMVENNLGVATESVIEIKRIDSDFFDNSL